MSTTSAALAQLRGALDGASDDLGETLDQGAEKAVRARKYRTDFHAPSGSDDEQAGEEIAKPDQRLGSDDLDGPSRAGARARFLGTTQRTETDAPEPPPAANENRPEKAKPRRRKPARDDRRRHATGLSISPAVHRQGRTAYVNAGHMGTPLDTLVTIRPQIFDELEIEARWTWSKAKLNAMRTWYAANDDRPEFRVLWARESKRVGTCPACTAEGEHIHLLIHAGDHRAELEAYLSKSLHGHELDVRPADTLPRMLDNGWIADGASYLLKAVSPQVYAARRSIPHRPSGPVYGPRVGWSRNILDEKPVGRQARPRQGD